MRIAKTVGALPAENALLDGEAVVLLDDGHSDFEALETTAARATLVAFDLLHLGDRDLRPKALDERRGALQGLLDGAENILFSDALSVEGALVFEGACLLGLEGILKAPWPPLRRIAGRGGLGLVPPRAREHRNNPGNGNYANQHQ